MSHRTRRRDIPFFGKPAGHRQREIHHDQHLHAGAPSAPFRGHRPEDRAGFYEELSVDVKSGVLKDAFEPLAVHVYIMG